ncbi:OmpA family protein [Cronobacter malonaticus]|uniref:OmpA family protein n=1 Tax=Cronobacter malonaticus TaxID=413503 RepID=UPI0029E31095|nr:OmpA family protein [Cronobacter malonaticus]ELY4600801.1 OmpA family protein [Cronobacter malonaticus]MEB8476843.1 OmpA family protein [Cronobacter malonaticus]
MKSSLQRMLWLWAGLLAALLCLLFLPLPAGARGFGVFLVMVMVIAGLMRAGRQRQPLSVQQFAGLPEETYRLPVVLVCGDTANWPNDLTLYQTAQGCWLKVEDNRELRNIARELLWQRPGWAGQLAVMVCVSPAQHHDESALAAELHELRWQMTRLRRAVRRMVPLLLAGRMAGSVVNEPLWQSQLAGEPVSVWQDGLAPCAVVSWTAQNESGMRLQQQALLNTFADWFTRHVTTAFTDDNPDVAPVVPCAVLFHQGLRISGVEPASLWQRWLIRRTALQQVAGWLPTDGDNGIPALPDFLLPQLPKGAGVTPPQRATHHALSLFTLAAFIALCASGWNNRQLTHRVAYDIHHYYAIALKDYAPKAKAVALLRQDAMLLNDWSRNGEPLRLGLGLYQGERLRLPLLEAIRTYVPPPPPPPPPQPPKTVRLDTLSLFDTGQWRLKPGSTKVLVNALVGIKARPGWLIVVAGHTDNVGDERANQQLSLRRAESVRDWMRDTGDVPESCFVVQGYGESRPVAANTTAQGRALNRRVEISLVPQADACRLPDIPLPPSQDESGTQP